MKPYQHQRNSVLFRTATRVIFALMLISMVSFTYPDNGDFINRLMNRLHSFFFDGSRKTGAPKYVHPQYVTMQDSLRDPYPPPPPPPPPEIRRGGK